ncbi:Methyltransferase domain-containing protein [Salinibacillus kushneri]|uniref:Methyltransferase domain-containing protein n=1 Tax=Salinibacillus kushneri TaxID=237682 RepID=A0A1I0H9F2_9BACI|nr:class I SAM-dependent methyltransferase [Salinibacillus kushneri]SET80258.1 Methyltransferase domain-containing protein [Salinibacillus kushneri]
MGNLFSNVAKEFSKYRGGYPIKFYKKLQEEFGVALQNQKVLDIATSNGLVATDLANEGCYVTGLDNSLELLNEAEKRNNQRLKIDYVLGDVTKLPFNNETFDVITAVHCWKVLPTEIASSEALRVLKDSGKFIIAQFDQLPIGNNIVSETEKLVSKYNGKFKGQSNFGFYPEWIEEIYEVGFSNIETFTFDILITFTHEEWRGRMRTSTEIGGSLSKEEILQFDNELDKILKSKFSGEKLEIPHRMFSIICEKKG